MINLIKHIDGLVQERRNSSALAMELHLALTHWDVLLVAQMTSSPRNMFMSSLICNDLLICLVFSQYFTFIKLHEKDTDLLIWVLGKEYHHWVPRIIQSLFHAATQIHYISGLVQDCSIFIANALGILKSCIKLSLEWQMKQPLRLVTWVQIIVIAARRGTGQ